MSAGRQKINQNRRSSAPNRKKQYLYEVNWQGKGIESNSWYSLEELLKFNKIYVSGPPQTGVSFVQKKTFR